MPLVCVLVRAREPGSVVAFCITRTELSVDVFDTVINAESFPPPPVPATTKLTEEPVEYSLAPVVLVATPVFWSPLPTEPLVEIRIVARYVTALSGFETVGVNDVVSAEGPAALTVPVV